MLTSSDYHTVKLSEFEAWSNADLAAQCPMQSRDVGIWENQDSLRYAAFMWAVAERLDPRQPPPMPLTNEEQREQGARCPCHGTNDLCPCQNVPDQQAREQRST